MHSRRSVVRGTLSAIGLAAFAVGCGSSTAPGSIDGTYGLVSVNAQTLPVVVATTATDTITITQGTLTLASNSYTFDGSYVDASAAGALSFPRIDMGTFTVSGSTLSLTSTSDTVPTTITATLSGSTLTAPAVQLGNDSTTYALVFQKQ